MKFKINYTMTNEDKIREILDKHFGHHVKEGSDEWYTRNYQNRFSDLQEMAAWKQEDMIGKFMKFLHAECTDARLLHWKDEIIKQKIEQLMKEE